jgi:signal transduction histidine kinase
MDPFREAGAALRRAVEEARAVTGARLVLCARLDPGTLALTPMACDGASPVAAARFLVEARTVDPGFHPARIPAHARVNRWHEAVYLRGRPVAAPLADFGQDVLHPKILRLAGAILGLRHSYVVPLVHRGQVYGSLSFYDRRPFTAPRRRVCDAVARQAMLALENALLAAALRENTEKLRQSWSRAVEAEERVRAEVSELLHGTVQTRLAVAVHMLEQCKARLEHDPAQARSILSRVQDEIDRVSIKDVREASHLLHPAIIRVGLLPAVRSLARSYGEQLRISVEADDEVARLDDALQNRIPYVLRLNAYRVVEEALNNVLAHANAVWARVRLAVRDGRHLELSISDSGRGFDPATGKAGLGLSIIEARVEQAGGVWSVESRVGCGTTVVAWLPLDGGTAEGTDGSGQGSGANRPDPAPALR